jgi:endonuclease/exonuclease/phosphatase (EEP) superfamily protein YafD
MLRGADEGEGAGRKDAFRKMDARLILRAFLLVLGSLSILATALPLLRKEAWWIRILDFPRIQIAVLSAAVLGAFAFVFDGWLAGDWVFLALLAASALYQGRRILPYTPMSRRQVQASRAEAPEARVRLLVANVHMSNRKVSRLLEILEKEDPDVILCVETNAWWRERLSGLEATHPFTVMCPLENTYGMILYSRLRLVEPGVRFLVQDDVPSVHTRIELPSGDEVDLRCLHPRPPFPTEAKRSVERDAELVIVGRMVKGSPIPVIVAGDLNDVAWSDTTRLFQKISGLIDPRIGRGFYNTFHARYPFLRVSLDHIFHSRHFRLAALKTLPGFGSDHFPILAVLSLEPDAAATQEAPKADREDKERAREKIEKAGPPVSGGGAAGEDKGGD